MPQIEKQEYDLESLPESLRGCVLTIGNFDGVHLGHRRIVQAARELAESLRAGAPSTDAAVVAMTLEPPPDRVLRPGDPPQRLTPPEVKRALLLEAGADCVVTARVDAAFLALSAEEFVERIILGRFAPRHVVEGPDFFFGRARSGDVEFLRRSGGARGFGVHLVEPVVLELPRRLAGARAAGRGRRPSSRRTRPERVSSSLIRMLVAAGEVESAAACLGRPFALYGKIVRGEGRGRLLDFPTANLATGDQVLPGDGVYAGRATVAGAAYRAAVSVGTRPTVGGVGRSVEAHLLDADGRFYDRDMALSFLHRLRGIERFAGLEALRAQIAKDVQRVRELLE